MVDKGCSIGVLLLVVVHSLSAQEAGIPNPDPPTNLLATIGGGIPKPTLGGSQFWGDVHVFHDWRIQQRVGEEHFRLLSPKELCYAEGTFGQCRAKLEQIKAEQNLEPMRGRAVILLHGLVATRWTMRLLAEHLEEDGRYTIVNAEYPSTRQSMADHARLLARVVEGLPEVEQLNFVGHSMGNIVIRHYLADVQKQYGRQDPRLGRVVMIAPPNHGALAATRLSDNSVFKTVFGKPGRQLGKEWPWLENELTVPPCQFGIIAGGTRGGGFSPFLPGDDDGRISVETTRLTGARDFVLLPMIHEFIANDPRTFGYVLRFLDEGHFVAADQRQPIVEETSSQLASEPTTDRRQTGMARRNPASAGLSTGATQR
ncbi:MAG: alpha/beta hydrolase [Planctomycetaceae bacterium]|nr:alpha/beta hydrolase [Planctomycetaceae bacterium]